MYKCEKCSKEFDKIKALQGHQAWHVKRSGLDKVAAKERGKIKRQENVIIYYSNPYTCKTCDKIIPHEKAKIKKAELKNGAKHTFCLIALVLLNSTIHKELYQKKQKRKYPCLQKRGQKKLNH